jgi:putative transposase
LRNCKDRIRLKQYKYLGKMARKAYSTDLSDSKWEILAPLIPLAKSGGHPRTTDMREECNAIYYHLKTGCEWDILPGDFPRWGVWEKLNHTLRGQVRSKLGKSTQPTAIAANSQSVKTAEKRGMCTALMELKR